MATPKHQHLLIGDASDSRPQQPDIVARCLAALALCFAAVVLCRPIWNIDLFWHIAAGARFVEDGALATTDVFSSLDPERRWITFQWGYQVLVHLLDQLGGLELLRYVHASVMLTALLVFAWVLRTKLSLSEAAACTLCLLLLVLFGDRIRARPHVFNLLGWCFALTWLARGPQHLTKRSALGMAALIGVWANLHAGGAFLFLIAASTIPFGDTVQAWLTGTSRQRRLTTSWTWWGAGLLAALCSPHFIQGNIQALIMLDGTESAIGEWQPSWHFLTFVNAQSLLSSGPAHLLSGVAPSLMGVALVATLLAMTKRGQLRRLPFWRVLLIIALLVLAHRSVRFVYVTAFALVIAIPLFRHLGLGLPARRVLMLGIGAGLLVVSYGFNVSAQRASLDEAIEVALPGVPLEHARYPIRAADFLAGTGFSGRVFCQANWGGYLLWKLGDEVRVSADGRGNYPASVTADLAYLYDRQNLSAPESGPTRERILRSYPVDAVVHQRPLWPPNFAPAPEHWSIVYLDSQAEVWIRHTESGLSYLRSLALLRETQNQPETPR